MTDAPAPAILAATPGARTSANAANTCCSEKASAALAGAVFMLGYWICMTLASVPLLPAGTFPRFQLLVMLVTALLAGSLALQTVRRQRTLRLAVLMPVLLVLWGLLFALMATPRLPIPT